MKIAARSPVSFVLAGLAVLNLATIAVGQGAEVSKDASQAASVVEEFWQAKTLEQRAVVAKKIIASAAKFDRVLADLERGRRYAEDVPRGKLLREHVIRAVRHPYFIIVPKSYTPKRKYPVRFDLHGGMGAKKWKKEDGKWNPGWSPMEGQIVILPAGWWDSMWWERSQVENFEAILRELRATWNINENRVVLTGTSDGGAALFFQAMRTPDRWSAYGGTVGPPDRLVRKDFRPDGQMHVSNLFGQHMLMGYGSKDIKVPARYIRKYMALFEKAGARLEWYILEGQGHGLRLSEKRERDYARFIFGTIRDPLPDDLSWATENTAYYGRRSWLVIDELGKATKADASNILPRWGTPIQHRGPTQPHVPWGRVVLHRKGNLVQATTTNVARFTLLIAPSEFDIAKPIRVEVDGKLRFDERVQASLATLLKWAAIDDERVRLFAAEIHIQL